MEAVPRISLLQHIHYKPLAATCTETRRKPFQTGQEVKHADASYTVNFHLFAVNTALHIDLRGVLTAPLVRAYYILSYFMLPVLRAV